MTTERYIVDENQLVKSRFQEFLQVCRNSGAHEMLDPRKRHLIEIYFGTNATLNDLRPVAGVTTREAVRQLIFSGIRSSWNNLTTDLQSEYPLPEVVYSLHKANLEKKGAARKGKPSPMKNRSHTIETRAKLGQVSKERWQNPDYRAKMSAALKKSSQNRRQQTSPATLQ